MKLELNRTPVTFLGESRAIVQGFNATRATRGDKMIDILLHVAPMAGAEEWIQHVLETIAQAKAGNGTAIQILSVTQKAWDDHASISPEAMVAVQQFIKRRNCYKILSVDRSLSWVKLQAPVADVRQDFGTDVQNIEKFEDGVVIKTTQRVGDIVLPAELQGHVIGFHMSRIPKQTHYQLMGKKRPRAKRFTGYTPVDVRVRYRGVGGTIKLGVSFGPNGPPDDIPSQIVEAVRRGYMFSSWSWGGPSLFVTAASRALSEHAIAYMTALGGLVGVATGDLGPKNGTNKNTVDNPAEYTWALAYGGTRIPRRLGGAERYWNDSAKTSAGGYGVSLVYKAPYQGTGFRLIPDLSGIASPLSGFTILGGGKTDIIGGTSVVPWLMKEIAKVSAKLGIPLGAPHPWLYRYAREHGLVTPVLTPDGEVDVRCGLGTPLFDKWLESLQKLVAEGRKLPVPDGFQWASFGTLGPALHIGELGGGFDPKELNQYCDKIGVPHVDVAVWGLNGGRNLPNGLKGDSGEVVLDVDVAADANDPRSWQDVPPNANNNKNNNTSKKTAKKRTKKTVTKAKKAVPTRRKK